MTGISIHFERKESDFLKVIAALLVVTAHYCAYLLHFEQYADVAIIKALSAQCGKIGVGIFFLLSGYGLMESQRRSPLSFTDFLKKRISKIYLPALVASVIFEIIRACLGNISNDPIVILKDVFLIGNDSVLWFVRVLLVLYIIFDIYVHLKSRWQRILVVLVSTAAMVCLLVPHQFASIPLFYLGVYISNNKVANKFVLPILFSLIAAYVGMFFIGGGIYMLMSQLVIQLLLHSLS